MYYKCLIFLKKNYLFLLFSFFLILYSSFNKIGPWDEYHLLYYFKNKLFFPFYNSNFTYYDAYLLGRFSPITGQEFNLPILLGASIDDSFILVSLIILSTFIIFFYILNYFYNNYEKKNFYFICNIYCIVTFILFIVIKVVICRGYVCSANNYFLIFILKVY